MIKSDAVENREKKPKKFLIKLISLILESCLKQEINMRSTTKRDKLTSRLIVISRYNVRENYAASCLLTEHRNCYANKMLIMIFL